jgi:hypothetical protein
VIAGSADIADIAVIADIAGSAGSEDNAVCSGIAGTDKEPARRA